MNIGNVIKAGSQARASRTFVLSHFCRTAGLRWTKSEAHDDRPWSAELEAALSEAPSTSGDEALDSFREAARVANLVPLFQRILSDHLTPVLAYRCLVKEDERTAPSFLFESVINGDQQASERVTGSCRQAAD